MSTYSAEIISDFDRDSLFTLPLSIVPLRTPGLQRARLIKNGRLESVVEVFGGQNMGSGQISVEALQQEFEWPDLPVHPDLILMRKLAQLPSFDVYSLRILIRQFDIEVNDLQALRLSEKKIGELTKYMRKFTGPLIKKIYGSDHVEVRSFEDLIMLFRNPNVDHAMEMLKVMADTLSINVSDLPKFLEDYGDIFLSLSYYRQGLDIVAPIMSDVIEWLDELCNSWHAKNNPSLLKTCEQIETVLNETTAAVTGRLEAFDRHSNDLWENVSAERFRQVEKLIKSCHTTIGGELCALTVKMEAWIRAFPSKNAGGPARRAEFIMSDMRQGIDSLRAIEQAAPKLVALN